MSNPEIHQQAFFKSLRLGDFVQKKPRVNLKHTAPEFRSGISSAKAKVFATGPSAYFEVNMQVAFKRGYGGAETSSQFRDRIRTWLIDLSAALAPVNGHSQLGPLSFSRDPQGTWTGERDQTESDVIIEVNAPETFTVNDDLDDANYNWLVNQYVLMLDYGNLSKEWEIAKIDSLLNMSITLDEVTIAKAIGTKIYRLDWHMPEVALMRDVEIDAPNNAPVDFVKEIDLVFAGSPDPVNGGW